MKKKIIIGLLVGILALGSLAVYGESTRSQNLIPNFQREGYQEEYGYHMGCGGYGFNGGMIYGRGMGRMGRMGHHGMRNYMRGSWY